MEQVLDRLWRELIEFPYPQICKHYAAMKVLQAMEDLGFDVPNSLAASIVKANDDASLAHPVVRLEQTASGKYVMRALP